MGTFVIACPGQGAQHPAMFDLALQSSAAATWLESYSQALDLDVVSLARQGNDLFSNRHGQLLMCGATVATWIALKESIPEPVLFAGYSVGEISAYGCAGAWNVKTLAHIISKRAALMDFAAPADAGLIAVKGLDTSSTNDICAQHGLEVAIVNADDHVILGGKRSNLNRAAADITERGFWCHVLDVAVPAHTSLMAGARAGFREAVVQSDPARPRIPVLAGISGCPAVSADEIAETLAAQIVQPINWQNCMRTTIERGATVVLELGPGKVLGRMFGESGAALESRSADDFRTLSGIAKWVNARMIDS